MKNAKEARQLALDALRSRPPSGELLTPLEYLLSDHFRQRTLCAAFLEFSDDTQPDIEYAAAVLEFMKEDFRLHIIDEEQDLFPLLRRRAEPEDEIVPVLEALSAEHGAGRDIAKEIIDILSGYISGDGAKSTLSKSFQSQLRGFAHHERRHLIVENAIVMRLARVRLTVDDLRILGLHMAERRGIPYPGKLNTVVEQV